MHQKIHKTKRALLEAFCLLLKTTPAQEITVSQLCRQAGINRTTFYKYYALPTDVVTEYVHDLSTQLLGLVPRSSATSRQDIYAAMLRTCEIFLENRWIMQVYISFNSDLSFLMKELTDRGSTHSLQNSGRVYFIAGGVTAVLAQWMLEGFTETPERVAKLITEFILRLEPA